jgi:hypothetical protein
VHQAEQVTEAENERLQDCRSKPMHARTERVLQETPKERLLRDWGKGNRKQE